MIKRPTDKEIREGLKDCKSQGALSMKFYGYRNKRFLQRVKHFVHDNKIRNNLKWAKPRKVSDKELIDAYMSQKSLSRAIESLIGCQCDVLVDRLKNIILRKRIRIEGCQVPSPNDKEIYRLLRKHDYSIRRVVLEIYGEPGSNTHAYKRIRKLIELEQQKDKNDG